MKTQTTLNEIEVPYHIPKDIKRQIKKSVKIIKEEDQDRVNLVTGREGSGKSLLTMQLSYYYSLLLGTKFDINNIAFTREDFAYKIRNFQRNSIIVFDESFKGLSSKGALSKENKELISLLIECRQRGHIIFIVLPSIFILEKYIAVFRSHSLFNVSISQRNYKERFYKIYNYNNKLKLYILGQKYMSYSRPKIFKKWRFSGKYIPSITREEYEKKKRESFKGKEKKEEYTLKDYRKDCIKRCNNIEKRKGTIKELQIILGISDFTYYQDLKEMKTN